ncbi:hypothetical protein ACEPAF_4282 [Sanghuangporus sanghuang]
MSPSAEVYSRFREPSNFDSDFASEHTGTIPHDHRSHRFPPKLDDRGDDDGGYDDDDDVIYTSSGGRHPYSRPRPQHYADYSDTGSKSRPTSLSHSRTTSSAKRSRKTSASTARDLVRALLHEKLEADTSTDVQLARAYDIIKEESRRAAEAERAALETSQRLKALALSRASAQKDASRAQSELRAYKLQLENAQRQLQEANTIVAASDAERARAEQAARKLKHAVEKLRLNDLMRRAREEGRREGLLESRGAVPPTRSNPFSSVPITEDDNDDVLPQTPVSNVPLPVPPPDYPPIVRRREPTPTFRRAQTPMSALRGSQGTRTPVPDVIRQSATPPSRRSQTPSHPVLPPASIPNRRPFVYNEFDPVPENRDLHINPVPDHIIIRSPDPVRSSSPAPPTPFSQPQTRPVSSQANHPHSTFDSQIHHQPRPQPPRHARHYSIDDPAARASASASRIYSHYSTSTDSSASEAPAQRPPSRILRHREGLPQQETIVPRPPTAVPGHHFSPSTRPSLPNDAVPDSAAAFARARARQGQRPRPASTSSTSTSSPRAFPTPSSIARLQRLPIGDRKWSAESSSSIPGITIEPPSRPESIDSIATGVTLPSHMSPFVDSDTPLPTQGPAHVQTAGRGGAPIQGPPQQHSHAHGLAHPQRPSSRTGFMYGSMSPTTSGTIRGSSAPGPGMRNFGGPSSPQTTPTLNNSGAPGIVNQPFMPPSRPGSAADYFTGDHRRNRNMNGHGHGYGRGHRREPAGISVDNLGAAPIDPNAFRDPGTDSDDEAEFRAPTPRATAGPPDMTPFAFGEPRGPPPGTPGTGSLHRRSGTPASMTGSSGGFIPPRPPSSASEGFPGIGSFATGASNGRGATRGGRNRKTSLMSGGANGPNGRPASRTAFGNTPFMRSSGLYDD